MPALPDSVPARIALQAGGLHLQLAPAVGGSIASLSSRWLSPAGEGEVHWLRPASAQALASRDPLGMASFPLVPFCNRIRDGRASFEGRAIRFPPNHPADPSSPHPLHGLGWLLPWTVLSHGEREAKLALQVEASAAWPWRFSAQQHFVLTPDRLTVAMRLTNEDSAAMPAGIGHHPYFPHPPGTRLTAATEAMWHADAQVMPHSLEPGRAVEQLRTGVTLSELDLDNNFTGWDRRALVEWPADASGPTRQLQMSAQAPLDFFVVYCPPPAGYFCAEPVSQCTDWLNLMPQFGPRALGGARLAPGATLHAVFTLAPALA